MMTGWETLLRQLAEVPRENGTPALHRAAEFLREALASGGLEPELFAFTAGPHRLRLAGVLILAGSLLYFRLVRAGRTGAALAVAVLLPGALLAELDFYAPVFGWIGAEEQHHVVATLPAREPALRLILSAHYDTKTDLLDHVERAPVDLLAVAVVPLMWLGALALAMAPRLPRRERALARLARAAAWVAALYGVAAFAALSAGAFVPTRSPGALDDGASCALLVRLAQELAEAGPLERTEVEVVFFSAEEIGVEGSYAWAEVRFARPPEIPTYAINLEGIGASLRHATFRAESFTLRSFEPDAALVSLLDAAHRERFGSPLEIAPYSAGTDARSFLAHGVPAITLVSLPEDGFFPRDLHSSGDDRARIDESALDASLAYLRDVVRAADAGAL